MKHEFKRVHFLRAANVNALTYGLLFGIIALIAFPFLLADYIFAPPGRAAAAGPMSTVPRVLAYPVIVIAIAWISGLLSAASYDFVVLWTGGLLLEFDR